MYLIISDGNEPFVTNWFDPENNFNKDLNIVVIHLGTLRYYDVNGWHEIKIDHL